MKSVVIILSLLLTNAAWAESVCKYSSADHQISIPFNSVDDNSGDEDQEYFVFESLMVAGYEIEIGSGEGVYELLIKKDGQEFISTKWNDVDNLGLSQSFPGGIIFCDLTGDEDSIEDSSGDGGEQ